jgi:hypothetical protein
MTVAVLGWGSLTWDPRDLPLASEWHADGPELPLEFARESRDGRMTLVVLERGPTCPVLWARLDVADVDRGMQALARREGVDWFGSIGRWPPRSTIHRHEAMLQAWAESRGFDALVWTDLKPGMRRDRSEGRYPVPSLETIEAHLADLDAPAREAARRYVENAPAQIVTPLREDIQRILAADQTGSRSSA